MSSSGEGPNPLRPYYVPPSVGLPSEPVSNVSANGLGSKIVPPASSKTSSLGTSARDILSDLNYTDYLTDSSPSAAEVIRSLLDQALWKYSSVLMAQPFEVAKTILQCRIAVAQDRTKAAVADDMRRRPGAYRDDQYDDPPSDDSDADEPSYFTSTAPISSSPTSSRPHHITDRAGYVLPSPSTTSSHKLDLRRPDSLLEVLSQLWQKEGAWGIWKGTNTTFIYSILLKTIESWARSMLSAVLNVPDPGLLAGAGVGGLDVIDSPYPLASLGVAVAAAGIAGVLLAPLDIVRARLILTPTTHPPRGLISSLRSLSYLMCPLELLPVTLLNSTIPTLLTSSTPLFLRSRLGVDPILTPTTYSIATFLSSSLELFLRLPLETVLRRGQISIPIDFKSASISEKVASDTVVNVGPYRGIVGTMWNIVREEGGGEEIEIVVGMDGAPAVRKGNKGCRKGQGVEGLWRGWRVGMWGLVGVWGAAALGGAGGKGGEF
ncbi:MAG: mitochondrial fusion and transport protein ugo1 [Pycnora praestabilis]|nr:MAG: mitochondrial fusion and transport protein ugo1 [Pycnora praestabilis]